MEAIVFIAFIIVSLQISQATEVSPKKGIYLVTASSTIRPDRPYEVTVSVKDTPETIDVHLCLRKDKEAIIKYSVQVSEDKLRTVRFNLPKNLTAGSYSLLVFGFSPSWSLLIYNETNLDFRSKTTSVFLQTDKAIYKAGQMVRFRAIAVTQDLLPAPVVLKIYINDAQDNRVQQWLDLRNEFAITKSFQLSDQPNLGEWKITVDDGVDILATKSFTVSEYVLPKFEVTIDVPKYALFSDSRIIGTIHAKYTFGKPITGKAKVQTSADIGGTIMVIEFVEVINGKAQIEVPIKYFPHNTWQAEATVSITAFVTEAVTNTTLSGTGSFKLYRNRAKVQIIRSSESFKPGLTYTYIVKVSQQNDNPLPGDKNMVNISTGFSWQQKLWTWKMYQIPSTGLVLVSIDVNKTVNSIHIKARYGEVESSDTITKMFISPSLSFMEIFLLTQKPKVGEKVSISVATSDVPKKVNLIIMASGDVVSENSFTMAETKKTLSLQITPKMAPKCRLVAYYINDTTGEVIAGGTTFDVQGAIRNKVTIEYAIPGKNSFNSSVDSVVTGSEVTVCGTAAPGSFVALLANDKSVQLLKSGNDITYDQILKELSSYDIKALSDTTTPYWGYRIRGDSVSQVLNNAGIVMITNANIPRDSQEDIYPRRHYPVMSLRAQRPKMAFYKAPIENMEMDEEASPLVGAAGATFVDTVRTLFPETWIWEEIFASSTGSYRYNATVPDTITSWEAGALSVDRHLGLGVTTEAATLRVIRPFFISMNLPYSVIHGETVQLQVLVYYYLDVNEVVKVSLVDSQEYRLASGSWEQSVSVQPGSVVSVVFKIVPLVIGSITIKVKGLISHAADTEIRHLLVKPEGVTEYVSRSWLVMLKNPPQKEFSTVGTVSYFPPLTADVVKDSQRAEILVIGDIMGITVQNLNNLVRVPSGCGEQNMVNFVPNILVLDYLTTTHQLTTAIKQKAIRNLNTGYQRELTYKRSDDSFSAFGNSDTSGSTWLTAFVILSFIESRQYIYIEDSMLKASTQWLLRSQNSSTGEFSEVGTIIDSKIKGGLSGQVSLTAYVLIALKNIQSLKYIDVDIPIKNATRFLEAELKNIVDIYPLCIVTYALGLVESTEFAKAFVRMKAAAQTDGKTGYIYFGSPASDNKPEDDWLTYHSTSNIEVTGYALLTYIHQKDLTSAVPIVRWLSSKRNSFGGFDSTQDTVIGLQALSKFAGAAYSGESDLTVKIKENPNNNKDYQFQIKKENSLVLQSQLLKPDKITYDISAAGIGTAFLQLNLQYNVRNPTEINYFKLDIKTLESNDNNLKLKICTSNLQNNDPGMVVMEITLPSGYTCSKSSLQDIVDGGTAQRVETKNGDSEITFYFNQVTKREICLKITADKNYIVNDIKEVPAIIYLFYQPAIRTRKFYKP